MAEDPDMPKDSAVEIKDTERIDDLQRCGLKIIQDPERFCFGMDAVLLSGFAYSPEGGKLLDIGTGTGILPLLLSAKTPAGHLTGIEIQPGSSDMAARSVSMNGLDDRIDIVCGDVREWDRYFAASSFDVITSNPPYIKTGTGIVNPSDTKALARHESTLTFEDVARISAKLLKTGGKFFLVHRPERLTEILTLLSEIKLEPKRLRIVYPDTQHAPNMILLESVRGGNPGIKVEKPLIINGEDGRYTEELREEYGF